MAKPELGTKRLCVGCGAKYYDLNRDPITCPKCGTLFDVGTAARVTKVSRAAAVVEDVEPDEELEVDIVSLEEADAEVEADKVIDIDDEEIDEDLGGDDEDDVFIDDEDEDEEVPDLIVERPEDDADR